MGKVTAEEARAYVERWKLVREAERAEIRAYSFDLKLRQLAALFEARRCFPAEPDRDLEVEQVRERWVSLRRTLSD